MSEVESLIDLYDSDRVVINRVAARLRQSIGTRRSAEGFQREVIERFADAGFLVDVAVYETTGPGGPVYRTSIIITGRVEPEAEFDHDRMRREVLGSAAPLISGYTGDERSGPS